MIDDKLMNEINEAAARGQDTLHGELYYTAQEVRDMKRLSGLSYAALAPLAGVTPRTLMRWTRYGVQGRGADQIANVMDTLLSITPDDPLADLPPRSVAR